MAQQYFYPTPLPTLPPNCLLHEQPDASGKIVSWCEYPTPTVVSKYNISQALPSYMRFTDSQLDSFVLSLPINLLLVSSVCFALVLLYLSTRFYLIKKKLKQKHVLFAVKPTSRTLLSSLATDQLFIKLHSLISQKTLFEQIFSSKKTISVELVSHRDEGIRYLIHAPLTEADVIKKTLLSYLPGVEVKEVEEYIPTGFKEIKQLTPKVSYLASFKLLRHFANPLQEQLILSKHDPIAYLTGNMTKPEKGELFAIQLVLSPVDKFSNRVKDNEANKILNYLWHGRDISQFLYDDGVLKYILFPLRIAGKLLYWGIFATLSFLQMCFDIFSYANGPTSRPVERSERRGKKVFTPTSVQLAHFQAVGKKLEQPLFEVSMRLLVIANSKTDATTRIRGFISSLSSFDNTTHQAIIVKQNLLKRVIPKKIKEYLTYFSLYQFSNRLLSYSNNIFLSVSELSGLYHLPYTDTTKTEDIVKSKSRELPAPLSLKKSSTELDVIVGKNTYGGQETPIGLTKSQRREHTYIIGKTGMGKSTIIETMALQDIQNGKGVCVVDAHGDMVKHLLALIPKNRIKDVIYINPADKQFPTGINILRPGVFFEDTEEEHEWITSCLMSIFMKITPKDKWGQRMEHILRSATLTALQIEQGTKDTPYISLYTIQKLLTDSGYRRNITSAIKDPVLKQFWQKEYSLFGTRQQADVISPLTNKLGEFITGKMSRHILLQEKSTINVSQIMDEGKILLVNLSKGELGEERSAFFGTIITSLIQLAAYGRSNIPEDERKDFFVYIDEFQNFATPHFLDLFSESRKFHVFFIPTHQNIAQIDDGKTPKVISGNAGTIVTLKSGPADENFILPFMQPEVEKGEIINLAPYHFFMKTTNEDSEDAFSGETIKITEKGDEKTATKIIENSRTNYGTPRSVVEKQLGKLFDTNAGEENKINDKEKGGTDKTKDNKDKQEKIGKAKQQKDTKNQTVKPEKTIKNGKLVGV